MNSLGLGTIQHFVISEPELMGGYTHTYTLFKLCLMRGTGK